MTETSQTADTVEASTPPSERARVRLRPERGRYDAETVHAILDEGFIAHVSFANDDQPFVIPTAYGRIGDRLYLHGSSANRMLRHLDRGAEAALCVTHVDGLVLARSAFHQSVNYRSVVVFGRAIKVTDEEEKLAALRAVVEQVIPGRWDEVRPPSREEFLRTLVLRLSLREASAKVRTGPPIDDAEDHALECWAGVVPLKLTPSEPVDDPELRPGIGRPPSVQPWRRPGGGSAA